MSSIRRTVRAWAVRTLRTTGYAMHGLALTIVGAALLCAMVVAALASLVGIGLPWLGETMRGLRGLANAGRRRSGAFLGSPIESAYRSLEGGSVRQLRVAARDPATYRDLLWLLAQVLLGFWPMVAVLMAWGGFVLAMSLPAWWWVPAEPVQMNGITIDSWPSAMLALAANGIGFGVLLVFVLPWVTIGLARLTKTLLSPTARARLDARVVELTSTRAAALDAHAAELRRIERDLHDTSQAGLVAIAVRLGVAERMFKNDPDQAVQLVRQAREGVETALAELRTVVRGIYPPILSDRGLTGAVSALAAAAPVPVEAHVGRLGDIPAAVEAAAYFIVSEALTNVAKHAEATAATVDIREENGHVILTISDDGRGGAETLDTGRSSSNGRAATLAGDHSTQQGSGLHGMRRRAAALDGSFRLSSPAGGPTTLRIELPCGS